MPEKQPKRRRLWLNDGSCIRLRAEHANHEWSYDFVEAKTSKGRKIKILNLIDEYTRECLYSHAAFRIRSEDVKEILRNVMVKRGTPEYIRSDNGSEFIAGHLRAWFRDLSIAPMYITPGSPWENGYCESFNSRMADEPLNRGDIDSIHEARVLLSIAHETTPSDHIAPSIQAACTEAMLSADDIIIARIFSTFGLYIGG